MRKANALRVVNTSVEKVDGVSLVTGAAKYTDDFEMPGMLHAKLLTSPHPHARIRAINTKNALALDGVFAVLTHKDVTPIRHTNAGQSAPEPSPYDRVILEDKVRFVGDRVAVIAAESRRIAEFAATLVEVDYEILPAVFDMEAAMQPDAPVIHDETDAQRIYDAARNIAAFSSVNLGDVEQGFRDADVIIERTYRTQRVKHCALETHGALGYLDENGQLTLITSTQVPFHTQRQLAHILNMPIERIRVIKPRIGGGFGNKQGMFLEDLVALSVLKTGRPVKMIFDRAEEFSGGYCRHPQIIHLKTGAKSDGTLVAQEMRVIGNTGAYGDHAPTVQECAGRKTLPLYRAPNAHYDVHAVYTNLPVSGAFRGYGAPQGFFAIESQMDELAAKLNMDPLVLRQKNRIRKGDVDLLAAAAFGDKEPRVMLSCGLGDCIERGAAAIGWKDKRGKPGDGVKRRGVGMACAMQGSGIAGVDWGSAALILNSDGTISLLCGATDLGTGADTILTQIAAEALGVNMKEIRITTADTELTPFDVGAYASSTTYVSGGAVKKAADQLRAEIMPIASAMLGDAQKRLIIQADSGSACRFISKNGEAISLKQIAAYAQYQQGRQLKTMATNMSETSPPPFAAAFAEVEVDVETGEVRVTQLVTAVDCGVAINPKLAEGQVEGAVTQGLGFALFEEMQFDAQGRILNPNFADYKIFNAADMPKLTTILVQTHEPSGPFGAKSIGEVPVNCPTPSVANAIFDAVGVRMTEPPFTAEKVLQALRRQNAAS